MWLDSEYCFVADTHVELLALSRTGLQAVPEAGERRGDAFGRYRMSAGGYKSAFLTSPLAEGIVFSSTRRVQSYFDTGTASPCFHQMNPTRPGGSAAQVARVPSTMNSEPEGAVPGGLRGRVQ